MGIGDCLAKVGVSKEHEDAILKGVDTLTNEKRMSEAFAAERVLKEQLAAADAELSDIAKQLPKAQADLVRHIVEHGDVTPTAPPVAKETTEHVPARNRSVQDDAKDLIAGAAGAAAILDRYTQGIKESRGGQVILADGKTQDVNVGTSYKSNIVKGTPPDPAKMRALIDAINGTKVKNQRELLNANDAVDKLNVALGQALKKSPDAAYRLQLKKNDQATGETPASDAAREHVEKYVRDVLGPQVQVEWDNMMHAGEHKYTPGTAKVDPIHIIRVAVNALDPQGTAYHESLHAFFQMLRDQKNHDVLSVLYRAADAAPVRNQLRTLLRNEPEALKQMDANAEERVAYMYQFYTQGKLQLGGESRTVLGKLKQFFMKMLGMWTNDDRAQHIMEWFGEGNFVPHIGDRNAVARALLEPGRNKAVEWVKAAAEPLGKLGTALLATGGERMRMTQNPAFVKIADLMQPRHADVAADEGFIQASLNEHRARLNGWVKDLKGLTEEQLREAHEAMQRGERTHADESVQRAITATRKLLDDTFNYMEQAGVRVKDLGYGKNYFPRIWDAEYLSRHQDEFRTMMEKYAAAGEFKGNIDQVMSNLMARDGSELGVVVDMPGMQHTKERVLKFIKAEDAAPYLQKNFFATINSYMTQASRRAEWARRFKDDGSVMRQLLDEAKKEHGATQEQVDMAQDYIRGIDGTLGDDLNPTARRLIGNMVVYQNVRLLPLAIFSSLIDPGGIMVRGGTMGDAWSAFKRGMAEIPRGFKKEKALDESYQLAQDIGAIDDTALVHALGSSYTQGMVAEKARKVNDLFFKFNLMEQFNMSMRVAATEAASRFVMRHAADVSTHSGRWLAELGLTQSDVHVQNGKLLVRPGEFEAAGMSKEAAAEASNKMKAALNRWVDGAVLRPNAADKPIWMNDPRWALIAHLKQFTYAFQNTILKRVWHEAQFGNYGPAMALAGYVPMMVAADLAKGLIQGGGQQPDWKQGWDMTDYLWSGVQRAGLLGVSQYAADVVKDVRQGGAGFGAVMGPTWEQLTEGVQALAGREMYKTFALHSLPANALYSHTLHMPSTDPNFAE